MLPPHGVWVTEANTGNPYYLASLSPDVLSAPGVWLRDFVNIEISIKIIIQFLYSANSRMADRCAVQE